MPLAQAFIQQLNQLQEQQGGWWRTLVDSKKVFIAIRPESNAINVYANGASVARIEWSREKIRFNVHVEYLTLPTTQIDRRYINLLQDKAPAIRAEVITSAVGFVQHFKQILNRAELFAGPERSGENRVASNVHQVIDMEAAFTFTAEADESTIVALGDDRPDAGRVDLVGLNLANRRLVFTEIKCFNNSELRSRRVPAVCDQLLNYHNWLVNNRPNILQRYMETIETYQVLQGAFFAHHNNAPIPEDIEPIPRLLIFEFDGTQQRRIDDEIIPRILKHVEIDGFTVSHVERVGDPSNVNASHLGLE